MPETAPDEVVLPGYFDLDLTGLESLKFTNISGLEHSVTISNQPIGSKTGSPADSRTVSTPGPMTFSMTHVVLTTMDLWKWIEDTIASRAATKSKKQGTLTIKALGDGSTQKSWKLDDVYLSGVTLDPMGSSGSQYLTANVTMLVGSCSPM